MAEIFRFKVWWPFFDSPCTSDNITNYIWQYLTITIKFLLFQNCINNTKCYWNFAKLSPSPSFSWTELVLYSLLNQPTNQPTTGIVPRIGPRKPKFGIQALFSPTRQNMKKNFKTNFKFLQNFKFLLNFKFPQNFKFLQNFNFFVKK